MQSQPTYQLGSREKTQYYVRNQEDYGRNQHHEVADNYIYQGIKILCVWCLLKSPRQTAQTQKKQSDLGLKGQKYFNIALVLQDERLTISLGLQTHALVL